MNLRRRIEAVRRIVGRNALMIRWLGLPIAPPSDEPGLILIQIDGLALEQFERAIERGRMPFVKKLMKHDGYMLHPMYSGLPSTTPAVQAELFYGVRCAVPAFSFRDPESGEIVRMVDNEPARAVQKKLEQEKEGLLALGSAYTNIYTGGASESHFCAATMGWNSEPGKVSRSAWIGVVLLNWVSVARALLLMFVELGIGLYDAIHGHLRGQKLISELNLIPSRVAVGVGLRELASIGAAMDVTRGLKVVQLNFLGYDEQAHRRGPSSRFAHWSLRGIDHAIQRVCTAARSSDRRNYRIWIYSDHGQERVVPYETKFGRPVGEAVNEALGTVAKKEDKRAKKAATSASLSRHQWLRKWKRNTKSRSIPANGEQDQSEEQAAEVVAIGPIGHVYLAASKSEEELDGVAERLVRSGHIPIVLYPTADKSVIAWTNGGRFRLPEEIRNVVGEDHPFRSELAEDLACLCYHPAAGELVLCGWNPGGESITFVDENGAHGGPGPAETGAFVLAPEGTEFERPEGGFLRPGDFHKTGLTILDAHRKEASGESPNSIASES